MAVIKQPGRYSTAQIFLDLQFVPQHNERHEPPLAALGKKFALELSGEPVKQVQHVPDIHLGTVSVSRRFGRG